MIRKIIHIDEEKCNGCGLCARACHESAIGMVDGKAKLLREDYCDGLGDCLPACPTNAISFVEREAAAYDEAAVLENKNWKLLLLPRLTPDAREAWQNCCTGEMRLRQNHLPFLAAAAIAVRIHLFPINSFLLIKT